MGSREAVKNVGLGRKRFARYAGISEWEARQFLAGKKSLPWNVVRKALRRYAADLGMPSKLYKNLGVKKLSETIRVWNELVRKVARKYRVSQKAIRKGWKASPRVKVPQWLRKMKERYRIEIRG